MTDETARSDALREALVAESYLPAHRHAKGEETCVGCDLHRRIAALLGRFPRAALAAPAAEPREELDPECVCEGEFVWACGPECPCWHHTKRCRRRSGEPNAEECGLPYGHALPHHPRAMVEPDAAAQPGPSEPGLQGGDITDDFAMAAAIRPDHLVAPHYDRETGRCPHLNVGVCDLCLRAVAINERLKAIRARLAADSAPGERLDGLIREFIELHDEADEPAIWCDGKCRTVRQLREYAALSKQQEGATGTGGREG